MSNFKMETNLENKRWRCKRCGYITDHPVDVCPVCGASWSEFEEIKDKDYSKDSKMMEANSLLDNSVAKASDFVDEHHIPEIDASKIDSEILEKLRSCFIAETSEVGMYLAASRQAMREGFPEIAMVMEKIAKEEAGHAARFAEILGEKVDIHTEINLKKFIMGEIGANHLRKEIADYAKKNNFDALHDSIHDICKDEARHGHAFMALYKKYFDKK